MKRIALFCLLVLASVFGFAQSDDLMDVVILMKAQYNRTELCRKSDFFATRAERREYVVKELKAFTEASQHEVRDLLTDLERQGLVSSVHSLWSANALYFSAPILFSRKQLFFTPDNKSSLPSGRHVS